MEQKNFIRLPDVPRALSNMGFSPVRYQKVYIRILSGEIPAERIGSRWYVATGDLHKVAESLDLSREQAAA